MFYPQLENHIYLFLLTGCKMAAAKSTEPTMALKRENNFDIRRCIICQKVGGKLVTTPNGRQKIMEAAVLRQDHLYVYLKSSSIEQEFV